MKNRKMKYFGTSIVAIISMLFISCVDDDFSIPTPPDNQEPIEIDGMVIPISSVLGEIAQNDGEVQTLSFTEDTYTEGYVVSSDEGGNFFKELWIQDKPENPTAAIKISLDVSDLFGTFNFGRKVYVRLDGLSVGLDSGNPAIGIANGDRINRIPTGLAEQAVIRDFVVEEIVAKEIDMANLNRDLIGQFVKFPNAQFPAASIESGLSFASEPGDSFDAERTMQDCSSNATVQMGTSTFSDFKGLLLPENAGAIEGVLLRAFADANYLFKINTVEGINFDQERCDPEPLCEGPSGGNDLIFEEDFNDISNLGQLNGWITTNTSGGNLTWVSGNFNDNGYAQVSGFNSSQAYDAWLVTPEIDMSGSSLEEFKLDIEAAFDNGPGLSILITDNFSGDVTTTEWQELEGIEIPQGPSSGFGGFSPAGVENISCLENIRFAFRYQGSDPDGVTTRYHLDNIRIEGVLD